MLLKKRKKQKGFTLIEAMIVVVIVGVIATMSVGSFDRFIKHQKLKIEGRDLISNLRLTRSYAVARKVPYGIHFDHNNQQYIIFKDVVSLSSYTYDSGDSVIKSKPLPNNLYFWGDFPNNVVVYLPNGSASSSGSVYFYSSEIYETLTANVLGSTGRARLTEGYGG
ncbi:MAG: GspH/FimT family protein [candidate division Zixibacteria bacterium]|nr:GspH/FimT family protein [candidate division Zixibacteria bacterium]